VVVKDRETIVIGGLITENKTILESGIPFLKDIPLLGYLFKRRSTSKGKSELIILLTPYVIENEEDSRQITEQQRQKNMMFNRKHNLDEAIGVPEEVHPDSVATDIPSAKEILEEGSASGEGGAPEGQ
jgi:type II secretory pathway component GspD/PulD (secretin)